MPKPDLSKLPRHIRYVSKKWYYNSKTGCYIPAHKITEYLPKELQPAQDVISKRWDLNY